MDHERKVRGDTVEKRWAWESHDRDGKGEGQEGAQAQHFTPTARQSTPRSDPTGGGKGTCDRVSKLLGHSLGSSRVWPSLSSLQTAFSILALLCPIPHCGRASHELWRGPGSDRARPRSNMASPRELALAAHTSLFPKHSPRKGGVGWVGGGQMSGRWEEEGTFTLEVLFRRPYLLLLLHPPRGCHIAQDGPRVCR